MRVLFKSGDNYISVYWIKITKNGMVTGWAHNTFLETYDRNNATKKDYHYYYPIDGNYHVSLKYNSGNSELIIEERFYWDRYVIKQFLNENFLAASQHIYSHEDPYSIYQPFSEQPPRLNEPNMYFQFATFAGGFARDHSDSFDTLPATQPKKGDLILDLNQDKATNFNIGAQMYSVHNDYVRSEALRNMPNFNLTKLESQRENNGMVIIELHCVTFIR